jgi:hypothetical protein
VEPTFLHSCSIPDPASKCCKLKDCDQLFIQANFRPNNMKQDKALELNMVRCK